MKRKALSTRRDKFPKSLNSFSPSICDSTRSFLFTFIQPDLTEFYEQLLLIAGLERKNYKSFFTLSLSLSLSLSLIINDMTCNICLYQFLHSISFFLHINPPFSLLKSMYVSTITPKR